MSVFGMYEVGRMEPKEAIKTIQNVIKTIKIARDEEIQMVWDKRLLHGASAGDNREYIRITAYPMEVHKNETPIGRIYVTINKVDEGERERREVKSEVHELLKTLNDMLKSKQREHETMEFYRELDKTIERKLNEPMESVT